MSPAVLLAETFKILFGVNFYSFFPTNILEEESSTINSFWIATITFSSIALEKYNFGLFKDRILLKIFLRHKLYGLPLKAKLFFPKL